MLLTGEFESPAVQLPKDLVPVNLEEAKWRIERAAFLSFGPAQYKMVSITEAAPHTVIRNLTPDSPFARSRDSRTNTPL